jgi:uracil-DNA glycosylase family 4
VFRQVPQLALSTQLSAYHQLLSATIDFLQQQKSRGQRHVVVDQSKLLTLATLNPVSPAEKQANPPAFTGPVMGEQADSFVDLRQMTLGCTQCPNLVSSRKNVVFGVGNESADLLFVGEAPGADEDEQGEPFVGKAGQLLTKIIETMGLKREDVYIANILKCRPDTPGKRFGNRPPTTDEMDTCSPWLHRQIEFIQPKVIVALGKTAVEGLLEQQVAITRFRGTWQTYRDIPLMPTFHPAYLLHKQSLTEKRKIWEDMLSVMTKLDLAISEKQQGFFLPR